MFSIHLKLKIQSLGALQPEAWQAIQLHRQEIQLKENESFIRKPGVLAYVAEGLLKEYDVQNRKTPSIINFIGPNQCFTTRKHNQSHYLKACVPSVLYYWDEAALQKLALAYHELKPIYHSLCAEYDQSLSYRQQILEKLHALDRIVLFTNLHDHSFHLIRKKDIANYLFLYYDTFIRHYRRLLKAR